MLSLYTFYPWIVKTICCIFFLLIVSGSRYSKKTTLFIVIPVVILLIIVNYFIFEIGNLNQYENLDILSIFLPLAILTSLIAKRKKLSLFTGIVNAYLAFYFINLVEMVGYRFTDHKYLFDIGMYIIFIPATASYLYFFYNKLHNMVEASLPKMFWLLLLYGIAMFAEIFLYQNILNSTTQSILKLHVFSLALLSVYIISIAGFYLFLRKYQEELISNFDNKVLKKQIDNIMEISELKQHSDNEMRIIRHDMKHVLLTISTLMNNGEYEKIQELINSYNITIENTKTKRFCADPVINAVLEYYQHQCDLNNINFKTKINNVEEILNIPSNELVVVISNCLDNAINASLKVTSNRYVSFIFLNNNNRLILQIKNKFDGNINLDLNNMPTSENQSHGFGTKSIEMFAKRHNITLDYVITKTTFEISLLFNEIKK